VLAGTMFCEHAKLVRRGRQKFRFDENEIICDHKIGKYKLLNIFR
jgi:hypothetical protein